MHVGRCLSELLNIVTSDVERGVRYLSVKVHFSETYGVTFC